MHKGTCRSAAWLAAVWLGLGLGLAPTDAGAEAPTWAGRQLAANQAWESLSPEEQHALRAYRDRWRGYSYEQQQRLREGARRYLQLTPEEQRAVVRERQRFERLPPEERRSLREKYRRSRGRE